MTYEEIKTFYTAASASLLKEGVSVPDINHVDLPYIRAIDKGLEAVFAKRPVHEISMVTDDRNSEGE
jgi:hypothetical protein